MNGVNGYVIAPDGFEGTIADSYDDGDELIANNLVFLPATAMISLKKLQSTMPTSSASIGRLLMMDRTARTTCNSMMKVSALIAASALSATASA